MSLQGTSTQVLPLSGGRDTAIADTGNSFVAVSVPGTPLTANTNGVATFAETTQSSPSTIRVWLHLSDVCETAYLGYRHRQYDRFTEWT
jgi:hypothetical protein